MRILIANHIDDSLLLQKDQRAFAQRIFWFAKDHDLLILCSAPDPSFVAHVASLTGLDASTLRIHVLPPGRFEQRLFDPESLTTRAFIDEVAASLRGQSDVAEIFPLWPSAQVAEFAEALGLASRLPGAAFFAQQGDELANNKGNFRAFAAACGAPIAEGAVCRTRHHAAQVLRRLLATGPVMVKQVHNGAGLGNQLLWTGDDAITVHPGAAHVYQLRGGRDGVEGYLEERWNWASVNQRFPVVIERFIARTRTVYAEFHADDSGVKHTEAGSLAFSDGKLVEETVPLRGVSTAVRERLVELGFKLAKTYRAFGYRGYMSADAVLDDSGNLTFTELNARIGGSLHLYHCIAHGVVDVHRQPQRSVVQYVTPRHWKINGVDHMLEAARQAGVAYDPATRKGIMLSMPLAGESGAGGLLFSVAYGEDGEQRAVYQRLAERLG